MTVGVILAYERGTTNQEAAELLPCLEGRFPGVVFAIAAGAVSSVVFEYQPPAKGYPEAPTADEGRKP